MGRHTQGEALCEKGELSNLVGKRHLTEIWKLREEVTSRNKDIKGYLH